MRNLRMSTKELKDHFRKFKIVDEENTSLRLPERINVPSSLLDELERALRYRLSLRAAGVDRLSPAERLALILIKNGLPA